MTTDRVAALLSDRASAGRCRDAILPFVHDPAALPADPPEPLTRRRFNQRLFRWHAGARRPLLIRGAATPWEILVAEVMSQQTGIARVGPAWRRFLDRWPTAGDLARAGTHELLAAWAGLGYNRRALNLRETARSIVSDHGGRVPDTIEALQQLTGIGPYTARAVAAAAYAIPVAPLDVNVRRVVSRVVGVPAASRGLQARADHLVSRGQPRRWLDAVMDLAARTCTTRDPRCDACPVAFVCATRGAGLADRPRVSVMPYPSTARWLRGRLISLMVDAPAGTWIALPGSLGAHDENAIATAASHLERDGLLELRDRMARIRA